MGCGGPWRIAGGPGSWLCKLPGDWHCLPGTQRAHVRLALPPRHAARACEQPPADSLGQALGAVRAGHLCKLVEGVLAVAAQAILVDVLPAADGARPGVAHKGKDCRCRGSGGQPGLQIYSWLWAQAGGTAWCGKAKDRSAAPLSCRHQAAMATRVRRRGRRRRQRQPWPCPPLPWGAPRTRVLLEHAAQHPLIPQVLHAHALALALGVAPRGVAAGGGAARPGPPARRHPRNRAQAQHQQHRTPPATTPMLTAGRSRPPKRLRRGPSCALHMCRAPP